MICMIQTQEDETTVKKNCLEKFCRDLKNKIESKDKNENRHMAEEKNTGKPEERPRINVDYNNTEEDPEREGPEQTKQKKSGIISEKGMRHISRITRLISEKERPKINTVNGIINGHPMEILFDIRGEFNIITKAALKLIEMSEGSLRRLYKKHSILPQKREES